jgi:hypothetical protein
MLNLIDMMVDSVKRWSLGFTTGLTHDDLYRVWLGGGLVLFFALAYFSYLVMRKALGFSKFRGTWYGATQWEQMIMMIYEDSKKGRRVMRADEMAALRKWRFGSEKELIKHGKGYF